MPRPKPGYEWIDIELPVEISRPLREEAGPRGVACLIRRILARRYKVTPPEVKRGRPFKDGPAAK